MAAVLLAVRLAAIGASVAGAAGIYFVIVVQTRSPGRFRQMSSAGVGHGQDMHPSLVWNVVSLGVIAAATGCVLRAGPTPHAATVAKAGAATLERLGGTWYSSSTSPSFPQVFQGLVTDTGGNRLQFVEDPTKAPCVASGR
jgi:hypothetical protein